MLPWGLSDCQCMEKQPSAFFAQARSPGFANDDDMSGQAAEAQPMISYVARMMGETVIKNTEKSERTERNTVSLALQAPRLWQWRQSPSQCASFASRRGLRRLD